MFVTSENNYELACNFWQSKPSKRLLWGLDAGGIDAVARNRGYASVLEYNRKELGCLTWATLVDPAPMSNPEVEVISRADGEITHLEYRSSYGTLTEELLLGQIIKHKAQTPEELKILCKMWQNLEVAPDLDNFNHICELCTGDTPVMASSNQSSAVQHMLQYETGVADFWFLAMDCPELLEECMGYWQAMLERKYRIMETIDCLGCYQAENTSSTMISPAYYEKYSLPQIQQFTAMAHRSNKRALIHMCGLLYDLMPLLKQADIDGIHALSAPDIGNVPFDYAFNFMPKDFFALGRFGSLEWINRTHDEIMANLKRILPHHIYQEHPFVLLVTGDGAKFTGDNLLILRDCIEEYEII